MDILEKLELWKEAHILTRGLSDSDYVHIDNKSVLFKHLNQLYGNACKIRVKDLIKAIEDI